MADAGNGASDAEAVGAPVRLGEADAEAVVDGCNGGGELIGLGLVVDAQAMAMNEIAIVAAGEVRARTGYLRLMCGG